MRTPRPGEPKGKGRKSQLDDVDQWPLRVASLPNGTQLNTLFELFSVCDDNTYLGRIRTLLVSLLSPLRSKLLALDYCRRHPRLAVPVCACARSLSLCHISVRILDSSFWFGHLLYSYPYGTGLCGPKVNCRRTCQPQQWLCCWFLSDGETQAQ